MNRGDLVTVDGWPGGPYRVEGQDATHAHLRTATGADWYAPLHRLRPVAAPVARARTTDPDTSHDAARKVNVHGDTWLLLRLHVEAGERGLTGDDIETVSGRPYQSLGPRRPWLVEAGWVAATGDKRNGKGVYTATPAGVEAWNRQNSGAA